MAVGFPLKTSYANGDVYQASDVNDTNGTVNLLTSAQYAAGKNNLLNGNMQVAQRGTSFTGITSGANWGADRYNFEPSSLGTYTVTNESDSPTVLGQGKSFKILVTTANASPGASAYSVFQTAIEGQASQFLDKGTVSAQISTLSFWVKSNKTGTYSVLVYDAINARAFGANYTVSASGTWEQKTITIPADATGTITNNNAVGMRIYWNLGGGSNYTGGSVLSSWGAFSFGTNWMPNQTNLAANVNNYWQITGIQWELGSTATAFQTATGTIPGELAACQRYYIRWANSALANATIGMGLASNTTSANINITYPVTMRTAPNVMDYSNLRLDDSISAFTSGTPALESTYATNDKVARIVWSSTSGLTSFRPYFLSANTSAGYLGLSAEL